MKSDLPDGIKTVATALLDHFGGKWWVELGQAPDPKGPGTGGASIEILILNEDHVGEDPMTGATIWERNSLDLYDEFLFNVEDLCEKPDALDDSDEDLWDFSPVTVFLQEWRDQRISYRRTVLGQGTPEARWRSHAEIDQLDFGGKEGACRTCGQVFYDNFRSRIAEEAFYCSLPCIGKAQFDCLECGESYEVGMGSNRANRRRRLSGWCSEGCENPWIEVDKESVGWVRAMVRRARELGRNYDSDITRRKIFEKAAGICHYCGKKTEWRAKAFSEDLATVDHVVPWEKGGHHVWSNVVLACWLCNAMKGTRLEFTSRGKREKWSRED